MPHDPIDRERIEHLREHTARTIATTRRVIAHSRQTAEQLRLRREADAEAAALRVDRAHGQG